MVLPIYGEVPAQPAEGLHMPSFMRGLDWREAHGPSQGRCVDNKEMLSAARKEDGFARRWVGRDFIHQSVRAATPNHVDDEVVMALRRPRELVVSCGYVYRIGDP